jgi:hypothetical protein
MDVQIKKSIRPILKTMKLHATEDYPIESYQTIHAAIQLLKYQKKGKFTTKIDGEIIKVTRVE